MKHLAIIAFAAICMLLACTKDSVQTDQITENLQVGDRSNDVNICHKTGNGQFNSIWVNQNAVAAHLAHGDYLPDADGDGYSAVGACTGSMDDCNDNNANVHPGAGEVCGNGIDDDCDNEIDEEDCCPSFSDISFVFTEEFLNYYAPFSFFYDSEVNNCFGFVDAAVLIDELFIVYAVEYSTENGTVKLLQLLDCVYVVGQDITEGEYESGLAAIRAALAANPGTPNYCDLPRPATNQAPVKLFDNEEALRGKMKPASPAKLLEQFKKR